MCHVREMIQTQALQVDVLQAALAAIVVAVTILAVWLFARLAEMSRLRASLETDLRASRDAADRAARAEADARIASAMQEAVVASQGRELAEQRADRQALLAELGQLRARSEALAGELAEAATRVAERERAHQEHLALLASLREELDGHFRVLAGQALDQSQQRLLEVAQATFLRQKEAAEGDLKSLLAPVSGLLDTFQRKVEALDTERVREAATLRTQISEIGQSLQLNREVTQKLTGALSAPKGAGRWGEQTLRRVLELSGLTDHVDFSVQAHTAHEDGADRPDAVIRLPGGGAILIDAKASLDAYLEAAQTADPVRRETLMRLHAQHLKDQVTRLARKGYWQREKGSADFVVMFVPGENFFSEAVSRDVSLIDHGIRQNVILATPLTLIALAKAVQMGWRQESMARNSEIIAQLGQELYQRLASMGDRIESLGKGISKVVTGYNDLVGTVEARVMPGARKFVELQGGGTHKPLPDLVPLDVQTRPLSRRDAAASAASAVAAIDVTTEVTDA